jgi:hypothetical protein
MIQRFVFQKSLNFRVSHGTGTNRIIAVEYRREPVTYIGSVYRTGSLRLFDKFPETEWKAKKAHFLVRKKEDPKTSVIRVTPANRPTE